MNEAVFEEVLRTIRADSQRIERKIDDLSARLDRDATRRKVRAGIVAGVLAIASVVAIPVATLWRANLTLEIREQTAGIIERKVAQMEIHRAPIAGP